MPDYGDPSRAAITRHVYSLIHGQKRMSANEILGDTIGAIVTEAHPVAGLIFEAGRAAMRASKNDEDDQ
jgi:hypothetical protein